MLFLDTNQIDQLETELDANENTVTPENIDKEIERLQAMKNQLAKCDLTSELQHISEARYLAPNGASNLFEKIKVSIESKRRYKVAQKRYNKAVELIGEIDSRIEDFKVLKDYVSAWPQYSHLNVQTNNKTTNEKQSEIKQLGE